MVTLVLGYYFGSAAGEKQAKAVEEKIGTVKKTVEGDIDSRKTKADKKIEDIGELENNIEELKNELIEELKKSTV